MKEQFMILVKKVGEKLNSFLQFAAFLTHVVAGVEECADDAAVEDGVASSGERVRDEKAIPSLRRCCLCLLRLIWLYFLSPFILSVL